MFEAVRTVTNTTLPGLKLKVLRRSKSWKSTAGFQFFWGYLWHEAVEWEPVRRPNLQLDIWHLEVVFADLVDRLWIMLPRFASNTSKYTPGHEQQERERENVSQGWVQAMEVLYLLLQGHNQYAYHCRWTLCQYTGTDWTDAKCPESKWRMFGSCFHQLRSQKHAEGLEWSLVTLGLLSSRIPCVCNLPFFVARWNFWNIMRWATDSHPSRGLLKVFCCRKTEMWRCSSGCQAAVTSLWCYECERPTWQTRCWRFESCVIFVCQAAESETQAAIIDLEGKFYTDPPYIQARVLEVKLELMVMLWCCVCVRLVQENTKVWPSFDGPKVVGLSGEFSCTESGWLISRF